MIIRETRLLVSVAVIVAVAVHAASGMLLALPAWLIVVLLVWLFRNPSRHSNARPLGLISPVDGTVVTVGPVTDPYRKRAGHGVTLRGNLLGPYLLRSPIEGSVVEQWNEWRDPETSALRIGRAVCIRTDEDDEILFAFSSRFPLRHRLRAALGERIGQGQTFGLLPFGGRVAVFFASHGRILATPGQSVTAGVDLVAELLHD